MDLRPPQIPVGMDLRAIVSSKDQTAKSESLSQNKPAGGPLAAHGPAKRPPPPERAAHNSRKESMLYVDHARIPYGRMLMSHLMADTPEELREIAEKLKMERWIQHPGTPKEHLDLSESKRQEAIRMGAASVTGRQLAAIIRSRRLGPHG